MFPKYFFKMVQFKFSKRNSFFFFWYSLAVKDIPMPVSIFRTREKVNEANAVFAIKSFYLVLENL